jgi:hypothetical protein
MRLSKYVQFFSLAAMIATCIVGCNIFNPTGKERIDDSDTDALIYEGYIDIQKAEYTRAALNFSKAIHNDSTSSRAWYGLAKAVLNQYGLNVFEMLKYAKTENNTNGFMKMSDVEVEKYRVGIDTVIKIVDQFIDRDTTGKTDKQIRFSTIANSYTILQLTNVAILVRKASSDANRMFNFDVASNQITIEWSNLQNLSSDDAVETVNSLAASAQALKADPDNTFPIFRSFISGVDTVSDEEFKDGTMAVSDQIIEMSDNLNNNPERADAFIKVGNGIDDDGDGCIDEEIWDGKDNDGDGDVDEDQRPGSVLVFKTHWDRRAVASLKIPEGSIYETLDIDMNGTPTEPQEWSFIYPEPDDRDANKDHRLQFAQQLTFIPRKTDELIKNKELARTDTDINNIRYDLAWRKANIGGCWVNYSESDFINWFQGRN